MNGGSLFTPHQGQLAYASEFKAWAGLGLKSAGLNNSNAMTTYTPVPRTFPYPLRIVVSPVVPFNASSLLTDIIMCDSSELGVIIEDQPPTTDEWNDPTVDIRKIKIKERYAIALLNQGRAIRVAKNVKVIKSYDFENKLDWTAGSGELPAPGTNAIV